MARFLDLFLSFTVVPLLSGFTSQMMWAWFVVPLGLSPISFIQGICVSIAVSHFFGQGFAEGLNIGQIKEALGISATSQDELFRTLLKIFAYYPILLATGYAWHRILPWLP